MEDRRSSDNGNDRSERDPARASSGTESHGQERYQRREHDRSKDEDERDEERYMTRLKPRDYKPSNYTWGYKDAEHTTGTGGGAQGENDEERGLSFHEDRDDEALSTRKFQENENDPGTSSNDDKE